MLDEEMLLTAIEKNVLEHHMAKEEIMQKYNITETKFKKIVSQLSKEKPIFFNNKKYKTLTENKKRSRIKISIATELVNWITQVVSNEVIFKDRSHVIEVAVAKLKEAYDRGEY